MGPAGNPAPTPHILPAPPGPAGSPQRAGPQRREGGQPGVHCQPAPRRRSRLARGRQRHAPVAAGSGQRGRHHLDQQRGPRAGRGREEVTSMTDTPAIPAPIANGSTPSLNKALAAVQAESPPGATGQTAKADGTTNADRPLPGTPHPPAAGGGRWGPAAPGKARRSGSAGREGAPRLYGEVAQMLREGQIDEPRAKHLGALITARVMNLELAAKHADGPPEQPAAEPPAEPARRIPPEHQRATPPPGPATTANEPSPPD